MRRDEQRPFGSGQRDVEQSPVLVQSTVGQGLLVRRDRVLEVLAVVQLLEVEHRNSVGRIRVDGPVTTQRRWQFGERPEPRSGRGGRGEHPVADMRDRHYFPFEPLRRVHGQDLHAIRRHLHFARSEALFDLFGGREECEHPGQIGCWTRRVIGDDVGKCVEMLAARGPDDTDSGPRARLDSDPEHPLDLRHQFGERLADTFAQRRQLCRYRVDACVPES